MSVPARFLSCYARRTEEQEFKRAGGGGALQRTRDVAFACHRAAGSLVGVAQRSPVPALPDPTDRPYLMTPTARGMGVRVIIASTQALRRASEAEASARTAEERAADANLETTEELRDTRERLRCAEVGR